ncbi:hypothetical protein TNCV_3209551 [Trichonephila clavipes]|nr:hypothetical protein TNCV_3209551 [Trichonephila clavipes]
MGHKDVLEFLQSTKNIIDADSDDGNEMNNAVPDPTSSEMRNVTTKRKSLNTKRYPSENEQNKENTSCAASFTLYPTNATQNHLISQKLTLKFGDEYPEKKSDRIQVEFRKVCNKEMLRFVEFRFRYHHFSVHF